MDSTREDMLIVLGDLLNDGPERPLDVEIGHGVGTVILALVGASSELRVGGPDGPRVLPFHDEKDRALSRRMFQLVPAGTPSVEEVDGCEWSSAWTFFARFERREGEGVLSRSARIVLTRHMDEPPEWTIDIEVDSVRISTSLENFDERPRSHEELRPPFATRGLH